MEQRYALKEFLERAQRHLQAEDKKQVCACVYICVRLCVCAPPALVNVFLCLYVCSSSPSGCVNVCRVHVCLLCVCALV